MFSFFILSCACEKEEFVSDEAVDEYADLSVALRDSVQLPFPNTPEIVYGDNSYSFQFNANKCSVEVSAGGQGEIECVQGSKSVFCLKLFDGDYIENLTYYAYKEYLLIVYHIASEEHGGGALVLLNPLDGSFVWSTKIPGFNLNAGPIENDAIYITAIGFVGKLDLNQGRFLWYHEGLFQRNGSFSSFKAPRIQEDTIIFSEENLMKPRVKVLVLNKNTGVPITNDNRN